MILPGWALFLLRYIAPALAVIGAVWWIHHKGYQDGQDAADARQRKIEARIAQVEKDLGAKLDQDMAAIAGQVGAKLDTIDRVNTTEVQPVLIRETANAPARVRDPSAGLTPGMFDAIEKARRLSEPAPAR